MPTLITQTPFGNIKITSTDTAIIKIDFNATGPLTSTAPQHPLLLRCTQQLKRYLANSRYQFDLPLQLEGTVFQQRVWQALQQIPPGKTVTYGMLAQQLKTSPRAVGNACRRNPVPVIVPCHRVTARNGLGGFAGATSGKLITLKTWLLQHESK